MIEIWKDIPEYEGLYQVSNLGRVRGLKRGVVLRHTYRSEYPLVLLCKNSVKRACSVHRLVAQAFIPNPENKPHVNHKDGTRCNNHVENLEWCTHSENIKHAYKIGLKKVVGWRNPSHKLSTKDVDYIRNNYKFRHPLLGGKALGKRFGVSNHTISRIIKGRSWYE